MLFISQPVSQKQRACKDSAENQGITELGHRLCDRCIVSEDCECHRKKDDQAADIEKNRAAQEQAEVRVQEAEASARAAQEEAESLKRKIAAYPQVLFAEGKMWMVYGSYGLGLYLLELDPATGCRKDGLRYADLASGKTTFQAYYGTHLASGSLEGGVLSYEAEVPVLQDGAWTKKSYYYLMCSYGSLSSAYNMRCGRSERPEGPYVDVNGNPLVCSTDLGTGNKMLGSFCWEEDPVDYFCPGHNDMFTARGVRLISYHCRTNYFINKQLSRSNNFHYLYLGQYDFNSDGWPVMNANRYAGEELQDVTPEELLNVSAGKFEAVLFTQGYNTINAKRVVLHADGTMDGAHKGTWRMYGSRYIAIETQGDEFLGVVMPAWIDHQNIAGLTVTAMGKKTGMALVMNSTNRI